MATVPASVPRSAGLAASTLGIARRGLLKFARTPQLVVVGTIQSALFLLIFRYVFGGAIATGGLDYVDFLVPGFITTGVLFAGMGAAAGVAEDLQQGFVDRLRSLPIPRSSVLAGRALADTALLVWSLAVTAAVGFAVGFRLHGGPRPTPWPPSACCWSSGSPSSGCSSPWGWSPGPRRPPRAWP